MIIVIIVFFILIIALGNSDFAYDKDLEGFFFGVGCIGLIIAGVTLIIILSTFPYNVDKKIPMYEEENAKIETKVKETVRVYMEYEQETYKNLVETSDLTTLLLKYPELNSNELIKEEINTYKENNNKLKSLKERQIDKSLMAWWLYFGK